MRIITITKISLVLLVFTGFLSAAQTIPTDPKLRTGKLSNGLTYYIRHNENPKQRADFYIVQKVGSILEEENQRGLAHFLEHMAFNGTKNFPGNTLIAEMEKKGVKFGENMNAYTAMDQTVYNLSNIPVNRNGIIDTALLILHDWSGFISLEDKDIDEERGVVREEWRTRSSGNLRVSEKVIKEVFAGTPYADRIPIGSMDIVNNFPYQDLKDYYKKWYRPDLQAIIVVGDVDVDQIEDKIKQLFGAIPAPKNAAVRNYVQVPDNEKPIAVIASDPEVTGTSIDIYWKRDPYPALVKSDTNYYKYLLMDQLSVNMFNTRMTEIYLKPFPPIINGTAEAGGFIITPAKSAWHVNTSPRDTVILTALRTVLTESERMKRYGFMPSELERAKASLLKSYEIRYQDRDKKENNIFVNTYVYNFLENEPMADAEWSYNMVKQSLKLINTDTINAWARQLVKDNNTVITITGTEKDGKKLPSKETVLAILSSVKAMKIKPYIDLLSNRKLMDKLPKRGKVLNTEAGPFGYTQWKLSNGAVVYFKKTDSREGIVTLYGYSLGGMSLIPDLDIPSAQAMFVVPQAGVGNFNSAALSKLLAGKNVNFNTAVGEFSESVYGFTYINELETMLKLLYLRFTSPRKDTEVFKNWKEGQIRWNKERLSNPYYVLLDTVDAMLSNHHPRAKTIVYSDVLKKMDYNKTFELYKERFADASGFKFFITGNADFGQVKTLVETYLGSLPSLHRNEKIVDRNINPPRGKVVNHFNREMATPKSINYMAYTGAVPLNLTNKILFDYLTSILRIAYTQTMREEESGTYVVKVNGGIDKFPQDNFKLYIEFHTAPDKAEKMRQIAYSKIKELVSDGPSEENVNKVKDFLLKQQKEMLSNQDNNYWSTLISTLLMNGVDNRTDYEKIVSSVTPEMVRDFAKEIFFQGNVIEIVMDPE